MDVGPPGAPVLDLVLLGHGVAEADEGRAVEPWGGCWGGCCGQGGGLVGGGGEKGGGRVMEGGLGVGIVVVEVW